MGRPQLTSLLLLGALLSAPTRALAQSAEDKAAAEAAFEDGKRLMSAHDYAHACPKLAESLRRDPGIGTMLGLADCYEHNGQTASAWAEFLEAAGAAARKNDKREPIARENAARLEPTLTKLVVRVAPEADVRGLVVQRDARDVGRAAWGEEVPVDPGSHTLTASAPGWKDWKTTFDVAAKPGVQTVTVPKLDAAPPPPAPAVAPAPAEATARPTGMQLGTQRIAALAAGGAGVIGVAVGTIFGLKASSKLSDSNANGNCDASDACTQPGLGLRSDAKSAALVSTVGFTVGALALAGGAILWFTAPSENAGVQVGVAPTLGGAVVSGRF